MWTTLHSTAKAATKAPVFSSHLHKLKGERVGLSTWGRSASVVTARDYIIGGLEGKYYNRHGPANGVAPLESRMIPSCGALLHWILALSLCIAPLCFAEEMVAGEEQLVDIAVVCPGVVLELRYATADNITGSPIYPRGARALIRRSTAQRLTHAQRILATQGFGLKIWDAYRPSFAQEALWFARPHPEFVGDPARGGSLHERGVAVDVTLIDLKIRRDVRMPTDFDQFGPTAARRYRGGNPIVATNLTALQKAMAAAGFLAMRDEWWHFVDKDFRRYGRVTPPPLLSPDPRE